MKHSQKRTFMDIEKMSSDEFKAFCRLGNKNHFTRIRKMPLQDLLFTMINRKGLTLALELRNYMKLAHPGVSISKPGYLKQRMKLNPDAFLELYKYHNRNFYADSTFSTYKNHLILAADGSDINIPTTTETLKLYGSASRKNTKPQAQIGLGCIYDVMNRMILESDYHGSPDQILGRGDKMTEYYLPDIPRLYTALAEWMACLIFILPFKKRFSPAVTGCLVAGAFGIQSVFLISTGGVRLIFWIPCMIFAVFLMVAFVFCCCEIRLTDAAYFGMIAFVAAEFMASAGWQILCYTGKEAWMSWWQQGMAILLIYGVIAVILYKILHIHMPKDGQMEITRREYFSGLLISIAVFAVSNMSYVNVNTPFTGRYSFEIGNIRTIVDVAGIAILYAHLIQCCELRVRKELEAVQNVLQNQYAQYKQSKESIELINYKYHDLKHQIAVLRSEADPGKREEFLDKMEADIKKYESQNKTGNKVLDTVLTTKSLYCAKNNITFTCVADGALLDFMDVMDICSIFGNALDNAIECELKIPDKEKRLIHVSVSKQKNFLLLRFENYYDTELNYQGGAFITTKRDKEFHGYGLKSIRYTVNKYDGAVSIDTKENWFDLKILIPVSENVQK